MRLLLVLLLSLVGVFGEVKFIWRDDQAALSGQTPEREGSPSLQENLVFVGFFKNIVPRDPEIDRESRAVTGERPIALIRLPITMRIGVGFSSEIVDVLKHRNLDRRCFPLWESVNILIERLRLQKAKVSRLFSGPAGLMNSKAELDRDVQCRGLTKVLQHKMHPQFIFCDCISALGAGDICSGLRSPNVPGNSIAFFGGLRRLSSLLESRVDEKDTYSAENHAQNGSASHDGGPKSGRLLGYKLVLASLVFAGFAVCIGYAIWLVANGKPDAGIAFWIVGMNGVFVTALVGFPVVFGLP